MKKQNLQTNDMWKWKRLHSMERMPNSEELEKTWMSLNFRFDLVYFLFMLFDTNILHFSDTDLQNSYIYIIFLGH